MATHDCPEGYTPMKKNNDRNFLHNNIHNPYTEGYWTDRDTAVRGCNSVDNCDGLLINDDGRRHIMRRNMELDTTFTNEPSGRYKWCVRDTMIASKGENDITSVPKRISNFERGVDSVDVTVDNASVCDGPGTTFKDGTCSVDTSSICGKKTTFNSTTNQCERDGGCTIM